MANTAFQPGASTKFTGPGAQTQQQIQNAVTSEVAAEIEQQISPLQDLVNQTQTGEQSAVDKLNQLYGTVQPSVENATRNLQSGFDQTIGFEKGIFDATQARLSAIRQQAGAAAQALSQQLGVQVPVSLFDMGALTEQGIGLAQGAGSLLTAQGLRDASLAEAEAFSGRVFPLMRTEAERDTRAQFETQIASLKKQIATIQSTRPGLINERVRQRLVEDRNYQLQKVQAQRDWALAKYSSNLEDRKVKEAIAARKSADALQRQANALQKRLAEMGDTTTRRGQDLDKKVADAQIKANRADKAAKNKEYEAQRSSAIRQNVVAATQAYINGTDAKLVEVQKAADGSGSSVTTTRTVPVGDGITNPNQLLEAVRAAVPGAREVPGYLTKTIISALRAKGVPIPKNWQSGEILNPRQKNIFAQAPSNRIMRSMNLRALEDWASKNMNFKGYYPPSGKINGKLVNLRGPQWAGINPKTGQIRVDPKTGKLMEHPKPEWYERSLAEMRRNRRAWLIEWIRKQSVDAQGRSSITKRGGK